jgi:hypothetical protein
MFFILLTFLLCGEMSINAQTQVRPTAKSGQKTDFPSGDAFKNAEITYQIIPGINSTWGYDIFLDFTLKLSYI